MSKINLFAQIAQLLPRESFKKLVSEYQTDKHKKGFDSWTHLIFMLFCHLAQANSNREVECGIKSSTGDINHLGCKQAPSKSTLSYQNSHRDWHLFEKYYFALLEHISKVASFKRL